MKRMQTRGSARRGGLVVVGVGLLGGSACAGGVLYVDQGASGAGDGTSWGDAFTDLHDALSAASSDPGAYSAIWIAGGVYTPAPPAGDRSIAFELVGHVALMGGFAGHEGDPDDRPSLDSPGAPVTVLSGDLNGDDLYDEVADAWIDATRAENALRVVRGAGPGVFVLDRLHIRGGNQNLSLATTASGSGAFFSSADRVEVRDCEFSDHSNTVFGAALSIGLCLEAIVEGSSFVRNDARTMGGAIWFGTIATGENRLEVRRSDFAGNRVHGVSISGVTPPQIEGGALLSSAGTTLIADCTFTANKARRANAFSPLHETRGGAVAYQRVGALGVERDFEIRDCVFTGNSAFAEAGIGAFGGAVYSDVNLRILRCVFIDNRASVADGMEQGAGGAIWGRVNFESTMPVRVDSSVFESNRVEGPVTGSASGSAISWVSFAGQTDLAIEGCRFEKNALENAGSRGVGGAVHVGLSGGSARVLDSVVDGNEAVSDRYRDPASFLSGGLSLATAANGGVEVRGCTISGNRAALAHGSDSGYWGAGGLAAASPSVTIDRCTITGNVSEHPAVAGSHLVRLHGGIVLGDGGHSINGVVAGSLITGNRGQAAGGVGLGGRAGSAFEIINATVSGNESAQSFAGGVVASSPVQIVNSIVWGNESDLGATQDRELGLAGGSVVDSSLVRGWDGSIPGSFTIDADPMFADAEDYRPVRGSPAIDSGDNGALPAWLETDLDGVARRLDDPATPDTGFGSPPIVDRGAYEYAPAPRCPADLGAPFGVLDLNDVVAFIVAFTGHDDAADFAEPFGEFDMADINAFVAAFVAGCR